MRVAKGEPFKPSGDPLVIISARMLKELRSRGVGEVDAVTVSR